MKLWNVEKIKTDTYKKKVYSIGGGMIKISHKKKYLPKNPITKDQLYLFLETFVDILNVPAARGNLRKLQLADTEVLRIFHQICIKHNIPYCLGWGTLLGAVRHKGFIPWDDDLDVLVPYDVFYDCIKAIVTELKDSNLIFYGIDKCRSDGITLRISHKNCDAINLDIFFVLPTNIDTTIQEKKKEIEAYIKELRKEYKSRFLRIKENTNEYNVKALRDWMVLECQNKLGQVNYEKSVSLVIPPCNDSCYLATSWVFPTTTVKFENYEFNAPAYPEKFLEECYGDYMKFPRKFGLHSLFETELNTEILETIFSELQSINIGEKNA